MEQAMNNDRMVGHAEGPVMTGNEWNATWGRVAPGAVSHPQPAPNA